MSVFENISLFLGLRKYSIDTFPVRVVVTGMEHSGTTLLSQLLRQDPCLDSGFECGFLLAESPREFKKIQPWYQWMQEPVSVHQWGVSAEHMEDICSSRSWDEAYRKLLQFSPVFDKNKNQQVCDKTPRYLINLDAVLDKLPDCIPCIVIEKEIENLWRSHKKRNSSLQKFCRNFELYNNGLRRGLKKHENRIYRVKYETLCIDTFKKLKEIFSFIGLQFQNEYADKRHDQLLQYYTKNYVKVDMCPEDEMIKLNRLKHDFSDLLLTE